MPSLIEVAEINPRLDRALIDSLDEKVSFVPMACVSETLGAITAEEWRPVSDVLKGFTAFQDRDVLVAKITPCFENGKIAHARISQRLGFGSTEFHVIRPDATKLDDRYLFHFLRQPNIREEGAKRMTGSAGQRRVPKAFLEALDVPLPPLPEQLRIAAILDKAEALRVKRREAIAKLDQLLQAVFLDMFGDPVTNPKGWPVCEFGKALELTTGYPFKSAEFVGAGEGIKLCRGTNVLPGTLDWSDEANITAASAHHFEQFKLKPSDIVVAMDRPWISSGFKAHLMTPDDPPCFLVQRVARLRTKAPFTPRFVFAQIQSEYFKRHCKPTETTIPHISPNDFRTFPILSPPQTLIGRYESLAVRIAEQHLKLSEFAAKSDDLVATTQQKAFSGGL